MANLRKRNTLIHSFGVNDADYFVYTSDVIQGKLTITWRCPIYSKWVGMLYRVFSPAYHRKQPTYTKVSVCEEWKYFSNFREWVLSGQPNKDWQNCQLDKDLLLEGNLEYSPSTCVFISSNVNTFIRVVCKSKGNLPIGVHKNPYGRFIAECSDPFLKKSIYLGTFDDPIQAHLTWKAKKHQLALKLADLQEDIKVAAALRVRFSSESNWITGKESL